MPMVLEGAPTFLERGTEFLTWSLTSAAAILTFLVSNDVTAYFLTAGLIYFVCNLIGRFIR